MIKKANTLYVNKILKNSGSSETFHAYELLDEIHCPDVSYSPSYIDIDYSPNVNTEIEVRYKCNGNFVTGNNQRLFYLYGSNWNDSDQWQLCYERGVMYYKFNHNSFYAVSPNIAWDSTTSHIVKMSHTQLLYDSNQVATNSSSFTTTSNKWGISCTGTTATGDQSTFNYYYCKIYESGVLVHEFLPAKRLSDNVLGFYDNTTSTFYECVGTFVGTSKSTPEYIDETVSGEITINKIYHNGTIYWGNVTSHVQQNQS